MINIYIILHLILLFLFLFQGCLLVPTNSQNNKIKFSDPLYLGEGNKFRFYPLIVDVNNDGHSDIVSTHRKPINKNAMHVWVGDGKGGFDEVSPSWSSPKYSGLSAGDVNNDGYIDLFAASHYSRIHSYLSDGKGGFSHTSFMTESGYVASRVGDINEDGQPDLIVLGDARVGIEIYLGSENGNWLLHDRLIENDIGRALEVTDLDNDGHLDIVASLSESGLTIFMGDGNGNWRGGPLNLISPDKVEIWSIVIADMNKDDFPDIIMKGGTGRFGSEESYDGLFMLLADGVGGWILLESARNVGKTTTPGRALAVADMNNDGIMDIIAGGVYLDLENNNRKNRSQGLFVYLGDGKGRWVEQMNTGLYTTGLMRVQGIAIADLNHDNRLDVIANHDARKGVDGYVSVWLQEGKYAKENNL